MNKRRSDRVFTPQALLDEVAMAPLDWPQKTITLERSSSIEYRHRPLSGNVSVAELYHENSKLYPSLLKTLRASDQDPYKFRVEFLRRRATAVSSAGTSLLGLEEPFSALLSQLPATSYLSFYAVELGVLDRDLMAIQEPLTGRLQIVKQLSSAEVESVRHAVRMTAPRDLPPFDGPYIFLIGNFARNEILFGVRGYRRTLIEAGQVAQTLMNRAEQLGLNFWPVYEFADRVLDVALDVDGTEQSVLVAVEVKGGS